MAQRLTDLSRERIAYHEAGHAVIGHLFGRPVVRVTILPDRSRLGHVTHSWICGDAVDRRQRALIGAGVGALAGGAVGYYMDQQEAKLRAELAGTGVSVTRMGDNITLNMPGNVTFATDSSDLSPAFFDVLNSVGKVMKEFDQTVVEVAGHTDSTGSEDYNQSLSERRAASVSRYFSAKGIAEQRLLTVGMGELRPVADNGSADGRQANRRVEITMVPLTAG